MNKKVTKPPKISESKVNFKKYNGTERLLF
ncbi:hypothetical protein J2X77_000568 [Sphingobacterium sp. 2149]|nr:hypothetical protein [Sphingobacterium sp. 2149]